MIEAFIENPILLLFIVAAIGYWVGSIRFRGSSLGVAAVLFVGLGFGGLSPDLRVPEIIIFLGLTIFVYTIGLSSGPSFFASFRQKGLRDIVFILTMLTVSMAIAAGLHFIFNFEPATTAGLYAGSTTNTPALAGLLDIITGRASLTSKAISSMSELAVVGYSLTYPMGVLGIMIAIHIVQKMFRIDYKKEEELLKNDYPVKQNIISYSVEILHENMTNIPIRDLKKQHNWRIIFGRLQHGNDISLSNYDSIFKLQDQVAVVGDEEEVNRVAKDLGRILPHQLSFDRSEYDTQRIFVSNPKIAGEKLATLNLNERFAAIITRVRRGDIDLLAHANTVIELGDQVRFVARRKDISKIATLFGDSYEALSRINLLSFGLGMALGLLLGMISFQLPGGFSFKLGYAGGPLIVALVLGTLRRTGPIVWTLPYSANLTLRQIGLILMLAGIGINSGNTFFSTISQGGGGLIFLAGAIISFVTALATLIIGYKLIGIPFSILLGMVGTQPAILDFAIDRSGNNLPTIGYTLMLPVSLVIKILYVQLLFAFLGG